MIREAIKSRRIELGLSQAALARLARVSRTSLLRYEQGTHGLRSDGLERVFKVLSLRVCPPGA